jgi:hypothetical protein
LANILSESHLRMMFSTRYLSIHDYCLRSLLDIIESYYGTKSEADRCKRMLERLIDAEITYDRIAEPDDIETEHFRNLRNAWYHEYAMHQTPTEAMAWRIIQAYYVVLCSISAMVRSHGPKITQSSHKKTLQLYTNFFLCHPKRKKILFHPTSTCPTT